MNTLTPFQIGPIISVLSSMVSVSTSNTKEV